MARIPPREPFLSPKAIEAHLRSIYLTLGIHRRHELAGALHANGASRA